MQACGACMRGAGRRECGGDWRQPRRCLAGRAERPPLRMVVLCARTKVCCRAPPRGGEAGVSEGKTPKDGGRSSGRVAARAAAPPHARRGGAQNFSSRQVRETTMQTLQHSNDAIAGKCAPGAAANTTMRDQPDPTAAAQHSAGRLTELLHLPLHRHKLLPAHAILLAAQGAARRAARPPPPLAARLAAWAAAGDHCCF